MNERRPDPDRLLAAVEAEERRNARGRLKVFLGAVAGVGKTFAMLDAAHRLAAAGVDVLVGWVETHGRQDTAELLEGLERLPPKAYSYRDTTLSEFDLDAALARRPKLLLLDELAHTNAPGSRHDKRWQDVEELLGAGLDVWTTCNIQHLESLNDVVAQVTGIVVRETVPDSVLQQAHDIELIDLPPEELLERLAAGKVYPSEKVKQALEGFFRTGNLLALRELALRAAAQKVDVDVRGYRERHRVEEPWEVTERLLVAVGPGPGSAQRVRAAARLAERLKGEWIAAFVETPATAALPEGERGVVWKTLRLAEQLGAEVVTLPGERVADELLDLARRRNATRLLIGAPTSPRWRRLLFGSIGDELLARAGKLDLHVLGAAPGDEPTAARRTSRHSPPRNYLLASAVIGACGALSAVLFGRIQPTNLAMIFILGIVATALKFGRGPSIWASVLAVAIFDYFFVPPYLKFSVADSEYLVTFAVFLVVANVISRLAVRLRRQAEVAREREHRSTALYSLVRDLANARDLDQLLAAALPHLWEVFSSQVMVLLPAADPRRLELRAQEAVTYIYDEREQAVADWCFRHGESAGMTTGNLPAAKGLYLPLRTATGIVGVLGLHPAAPEELLNPETRQLLGAYANQLALGIERLTGVHGSASGL